MSDCQHQQCCCQLPTSNVHQSLDELEFERGIWGAAQAGELHRIRTLVSKGEDLNRCDYSGYTALHYAARNGHLDVCKFLIANGANVDATTRAGCATPLQRASTMGQLDIVQLLLTNGANAQLQDGDGKTALHRAAESNHMDIFNALSLHDNRVQCVKDKKGNLPGDYLKFERN